MNKIDTIIWDWNGTLLDDLDLCIYTINVLLEKRKLPLLDKKRYKEVFSFPVKEYYQSVGFDFRKEEFAIPAKEFTDLYNQKVSNCNLHSASVDVLNYYKTKGYRQFVLSAMKQKTLEETLKQKRIFEYFEGIAGLNDHYAVSKLSRGFQLIQEFSIEKSKSCIIGDTLHDFEVAAALGIKCILIPDGHQSLKRLQKTGTTIIENIEQLIKREEIILE